MPKMKTNRAAAKRFKRTAKGGFKSAQAFTSVSTVRRRNNVVNCVAFP